MAFAPFLRTVRHLRAEQIVHRLWARARRPWLTSAAYRRLYLPHEAEPPVGFPPALWPGSGDRGRRILGGEIELVGVPAAMAVPVDWVAADKPALWQFNLHYFEWLADLAALRTEQAVDGARALVADWIGRHGRGPGTGSPWAWHPYPLSLRLFAWMVHGPMLLQGAPPRFQQAFIATLHRQARHLTRCVEWDLGGNHVIKNLKALTVAGHFLPGHEETGRRAMQDLEPQVAVQVLPDGCHEERSPSYHLQVLMDLMDLQAILADDTPGWLADAVRRMGTALATMRLGDGGLALFNDGDVGDCRHLAAVESRLPAESRHPAEALPDAGYYRLSAGGSVVLMDAGKCCPDHLPGHAHADMLSFEMSSGRRRLIVNGGTFAYQDTTWRHRLRGTASHSTVTIDGKDSAEVYGAFRLGRRPRHVTGKLRNTSAGPSVAGSHDGYRHLGWHHDRRLTLNESGTSLAGEDTIRPIRRRSGEGEAAARFHLHPGVTARRQGENEVTLSLGEETWLLSAPRHAVDVEPSLYAPCFGTLLDTRQAVIRAPLRDDGMAISWSITRQPR